MLLLKKDPKVNVDCTNDEKEYKAKFNGYVLHIVIDITQNIHVDHLTQLTIC